MQTKANNTPNPLMWMVGISVILFCMVGIAALMGWIPTSFGNPAETAAAGSISSAPTSPVVAVPKARKAPALAAEKVVVRASCENCGVIESTQVVDTPGDTGVLGVVGGALVGGVLGNQVGGGRGKDLATVAGAVGGAVAGNQIEKQARSSKRYETTVRFDDGSTRMFSDTTQPQWRPGDRIRVINGLIRLRG